MRLTPGCPVITMRLPYFIRYEVLNVITMRCPYLIRYEVLCHCERSVAISRKGNRFLFSPVAPTFIVFYSTVNMTLLPNIWPTVIFFSESYKSLNYKNREYVTKIQLNFLVYNKVTLPGDSHVALLLRMTEYFVRKGIISKNSRKILYVTLKEN